MRILFVGLALHRNTLSDQPLLEILRGMGEVQEVRVGPGFTHEDTARAITTSGCDTIVYFQQRPASTRHLWRFRHLKQVWVPMYDWYEPFGLPDMLLMRLTGLRVVSHCDYFSQAFKGFGIPTLRVSYFPQPRMDSATTAMKPPYTVFLWQRVPEVSLSDVVKVFPPGTVGKVVYKIDKGDPVTSGYPFEVQVLKGWLSLEELYGQIAACDYYMAPRLTEGIGLGYLEAMALGKVVVAHCAPTHSEYIQEGVNGHLYTKAGALNSDWAPPGSLAPAIAKFNQSAHATWLRDRQRIRDFITSV